MKRKAIYFLLLFTLLGGCKEEEKPEQEAFIFGQWNFRCQGNCIQIYKYVGGKLYVDNLNSFREAPVITYSPTPLDAKYAPLAASLESSFPKDYLMPRGLTLIACPLCVEEGGYYLAFEREAEIIWWQVGKIPELWPEEIRPFMEKLVQTIPQLPEQ
ncbi:MAG: hypothetical protein ACK5BR_09890 [Bacteroidota bacterium]|jgi:hypothetical protein|nr:hypothetical protein [Algoriphagus sp.]